VNEEEEKKIGKPRDTFDFFRSGIGMEHRNRGMRRKQEKRRETSQEGRERSTGTSLRLLSLEKTLQRGGGGGLGGGGGGFGGGGGGCGGGGGGGGGFFGGVEGACGWNWGIRNRLLGALCLLSQREILQGRISPEKNPYIRKRSPLRATGSANSGKKEERTCRLSPASAILMSEKWEDPL